MLSTCKFDDKKIEVTAEIGCNHQGDVEFALKMIEEAAGAGADNVKFQKRDNRSLFGDCIYNQVYDNPNSYGQTYGQHREQLELSADDFQRIKKCTTELNIGLQVTPFDFQSLEFCDKIGFDSYKIASADLHFHQLIKKICELGRDVYLSTGGSTEEEISGALDVINSYNVRLTLYHCTAAYPAAVEEMNLAYISRMIDLFGHSCAIGLSDHENGIDAATVAYMLGARAFEKHFTLDRSLKGTDQSFSLEPVGLRKMIRNLKRIDEMLGSGEKQIFQSEERPLAKMVKSLIYARDLAAGEKVNSECFDYRVTLIKELKPSEEKKFIGKILQTAVKAGTLVSAKDFEA